MLSACQRIRRQPLLLALLLAALTACSAEYKHVWRYSAAGMADATSLHSPGYKAFHTQNHTVLDAEMLASRPYCGLLTNSSDEEGAWYRDSDGYWAYEPHGCRLRRLSAAQAARCLAGKRIALIGDSITRYQYLSLIHFLTTGYYQHPYDGDVHQNRTSFTVSHTWEGKMNGMYWRLPSHAMQLSGGKALFKCVDCCEFNAQHRKHEEWHFLQPQADKAPLMLDCYYVRPIEEYGTQLSDAMDWAFWPYNKWQYKGRGRCSGSRKRQMSRSISEGGPARRVSSLDDVSHLQGRSSHLRGHTSVRHRRAAALGVGPEGAPGALPLAARQGAPLVGHAGTVPRRSSLVAGNPGGWGLDATQTTPWRMPDVLLFNPGCTPAGTEADARVAFNAALSRANWHVKRMAVEAGATNTTRIWKRTTTGWWNNKSNRSTIALEAAQAHGWQVYNARAVAAAGERQGLMLMWQRGSVHFVHVVYEQLNDLLLNRLCPPEAAS